MGAREEIIKAAWSLTGAGQSPFSPRDLIAEARRAGSNYPDSTLRTEIVGPMCANSPDNHAVQYGDLYRIGRAQYVLNDASVPAVQEPTRQRSDQPTPPTGSASAESPDHRGHWTWEGNVQARVVAHLAAQGWGIERVADTRSKESGVDVIARRGGERLFVEVKGYPSLTYTSGAKSGQRKAHHATQARHYFADAFMAVGILRSEHPTARIAIAVPRFITYQNLADRLIASLEKLQIDVIFVNEDGTVDGL